MEQYTDSAECEEQTACDESKSNAGMVLPFHHTKAIAKRTNKIFAEVPVCCVFPFKPEKNISSSSYFPFLVSSLLVE